MPQRCGRQRLRETSIHGELHILILSESEEHRQLVRAAVSQEPGLDTKLVECTTLATAKPMVENRPFDLILLDTCVSDAHWLIENGATAAVIFLAYHPHSPTMNEIMSLGATDYYSKPQYREDPQILWLALRQSLRYHLMVQSRNHLVNILRDRDTMISNLSQRLWRNAPYDFRTGWFSHKEIVARLQEELYRSDRYKLPLSMILGDLQPVAELEESEGDELADSVLAQVSARTRSLCRQTDLVGHYGNDAFLILLTNTESNGAKRFCQRLNQCFEEPIAIRDGRKKSLSFIYGIAAHELAGNQSVSQLLQQAQERLERARQVHPPHGYIAD